MGKVNLQGEKGSVLAEAAAIIPLLVFLLIGVVDVTQALNIYSRLTRIAYEGVRYGSALPQLSQGCAALPTTQSCTQNTNLGHQNVMSRVQQLVLQSGFRNGQSARIETRLAAPPPPNDDVERVVTVRVELEYQPLFVQAFGVTLPIRVQSDGAYLFQSW